MRRILFLLSLLLFGGATLLAQELTVKTFEQRTRDLTAKVKPRTAPVNGDPCALVRVQVAAPNCVFEGSYIVGEVEQGFGEYLVYMAKGARNLRIAHPDFLFTPLDFTFPEPLEGNLTYALILEVPVYTHYAEIVEQQSQEPQRSTTRTVSTTPVSQSKVWQVGDYYNVNGKEGVVFWVDTTGKHGKIVSMTEPGSRLKWSSDQKEQGRLIGADSKTDGAKNLTAVKRIPDWQSKYPAFKWCADLGEGWYLPAIEELELFTLNDAVYDKVNRTLSLHGGKPLANKGDLHWYWSSTESSVKYRVFCAWIVTVYNGTTGNLYKNYRSYVRAVSAF